MFFLIVYSCKNTRCEEKFKWAAQLYRHMEKCKHPKPVSAPKFVCCERKFICQGCKKSFLYQPNIVKHVKTCKGIMVMHSCEMYSRELKFRSLLQKHLSGHKDRNLQCNVCNS